MEPDIIKLREIKPELAGYIKKAQSLINISTLPDEKSVHDIRVLMKKAKAVLRLIDSQIDNNLSTREARSIREVNKIMSSWRDTSVFRKTLKEMKKKHPSVFSKLEDNVVLSDMMIKPEAFQDKEDEIKADLLQINELLKKTGYRLRFEPMNSLNPQLLIRELEISYKQVVNNYLICRNNQKQSNIHEFRKRSKDFLYQLWFFRPLNASVIKALEKKLDNMAQNLGRYNDINQLIKAIGYKYEYTLNEPALDELAIILRDKQDEYLTKVWPVAYKIFCPGQNLPNLLGFRLLAI
jgi:CHAD domain-containing protein